MKTALLKRRASPAQSAGQVESWPSRRLSGRAAAVLFLACGLMTPFCLLPPRAPGLDTRAVLLVGLGAVLLAPVSWFLPWQRWPSWVGVSRVVVGLGLLALLNTFEGNDPYLYAVFFLPVFVWIGVAYPSLTALKLLPLFAAAYLLPLLSHPGHIAQAAQAGIYVGILCLLVAEVPAWLVGRWRRSQAALEETRAAMQEIIAELSSGRDPERLWEVATVKLSGLLDVPNCDVYRTDADEGLLCIASVCDGKPCSEYLGRRAGLSLWAIDREAISTRRPVLIASPDDPRLSAAECAEMLEWNEKAVAVVPMFLKGEAIGLVELGETRPDRTITAEQIATAESICQLIAMSIHDKDVLATQEQHARKLEALLASSQAVATVNDIGAELAVATNPGELWSSMSLRLSQLVDLPDCDVYRLMDDGRLVCLASVYEDEPCPGYVADYTEEQVWGADREAVRTREPVFIPSPDDPRLSEKERADMHAWGERAMLIVPLIARDEVIGLVEISETREGRTIEPEQISTVVSVCRLIAMALRDAELLEAQEGHARRLTSLLESSRAIASAGSMEEALAIVTQSAVELFGLTSGIAYEYDPELEAIIPRAMWERTPSDWNKLGEPLPLADSPVERGLLASGGAVLECISDPQLDPASRATMEHWGEKSCLTVAMQSVDGPMGLLTLWDAEHERRYTEDELAMASALAELAGEAVRSAKLLRRLRCLSETDSLTGLANHRKIHEFLALEQARAERYHGRFSLAMLDIDDFKLLNDTYGHPAGDVVLRQVAGLLKESTRASDVVGRYGGDEFLLILPETGSAEAAVLAEKLRAALAEKPYITPAGERIPLCASFGIAAYPADARDANELVVVADANLYASKRRGGDAVTGSGEAQSARKDDGGAFGLFESLVTAVDNKDSYTRRHSEEVTEHALALAAGLGLSEASQRVVRVAALLHDVGKIGIPDRILRKPGHLSEAEYETVKGHPLLGETIIAAIPDLTEIRAAVVSHHERYDGSGYPHGLAGQEIPLLGRILAVADAYSAMTADRPYRKALSRDEALDELRAGSGTQFDPDVVEAFIRRVVSGSAATEPERLVTKV